MFVLVSANTEDIWDGASTGPGTSAGRLTAMSFGSSAFLLDRPDSTVIPNALGASFGVTTQCSRPSVLPLTMPCGSEQLHILYVRSASVIAEQMQSLARNAGFIKNTTGGSFHCLLGRSEVSVIERASEALRPTCDALGIQMT